MRRQALWCKVGRVWFGQVLVAVSGTEAHRREHAASSVVFHRHFHEYLSQVIVSTVDSQQGSNSQEKSAAALKSTYTRLDSANTAHSQPVSTDPRLDVGIF